MKGGGGCNYVVYINIYLHAFGNPNFRFRHCTEHRLAILHLYFKKLLTSLINTTIVIISLHTHLKLILQISVCKKKY